MMPSSWKLLGAMRAKSSTAHTHAAQQTAHHCNPSNNLTAQRLAAVDDVNSIARYSTALYSTAPKCKRCTVQHRTLKPTVQLTALTALHCTELH
jgi:hypothetical protein